MPGPFQHPEVRVTTGYINTVNDALVAQVVSSGTGQAKYAQLGQRYFVGSGVKYDSSIGTLYGGCYQYVQFKSTSTIAPARGLVCFWSDFENFIVTPDAPTGASLIAGVYVSAPTKGNYGFIQIMGKATVQFGTVTKVTPAIGDLVVVDATTSKGDVLLDATALTSVEARHALGIAIEAPASAGLKLVHLNNSRINV